MRFIISSNIITHAHTSTHAYINNNKQHSNCDTVTASTRILTFGVEQYAPNYKHSVFSEHGCQ